MSHDTIFGSGKDMNDTIFCLPRVLACPIFSCKAKISSCKALYMLPFLMFADDTGTPEPHNFPNSKCRITTGLNSSKLGPLGKLNGNSKTMHTPCGHVTDMMSKLVCWQARKANAYEMKKKPNFFNSGQSFLSLLYSLQNSSLPSLSPQYVLLGRSFTYSLVVVIQGYYSLSISSSSLNKNLPKLRS